MNTNLGVFKNRTPGGKNYFLLHETYPSQRGNKRIVLCTNLAVSGGEEEPVGTRDLALPGGE